MKNTACLACSLGQDIQQYYSFQKKFWKQQKKYPILLSPPWKIIMFKSRMPQFAAESLLILCWRMCLIFPTCSSVSFLFHCTNDCSTGGGAWRCENRGVADPGDSPSALWHARVCQDRSQATLVMKVKSPRQHCSPSIYQAIAKLWCNSRWIS